MSVLLGELLVEKGLVTPERLSEALSLQRDGDKELGIAEGEKLGRILLSKKIIEPMALVKVLYEQKGGVDFLFVGDYMVEPRAVSWLPEELAMKYIILPLVSMDDETLLVATTNGVSHKLMDMVSAEIGRAVEPVEVHDDMLPLLIERCYALFKKRGLSSLRIGEILLRDGYLAADSLEWALEESRVKQRLLGRILIEKDMVNEDDFFRVLSLQKKMTLVRGVDVLPVLERDLSCNMSKAFCLRNLVVPYKTADNKVHVVTAEPSINIDELAMALKCKKVELELITYTDMESVLRTLFTSEKSEIQESQALSSYVDELEDVSIADELAPAASEDEGTLTRRYRRLADSILHEAIRKRASDIHLECYLNEVVVRFRIDGTLYDMNYSQIDKKNVGGLVNVYKIQSGMNIAERRMPQSGRFRKKTSVDDIYDFRLQSQPTIYGENLVIRLLSQSAPLLPLSDLGFSKATKSHYERIMQNPSGLILITGPTGSGKTTTLYSTLAILASNHNKKIITIEDPVEYSIPRIQQCQVKEEIGFDFAKATRAFLREDPDIMLVGEIRDLETAIEALRASQTGHLVLSTLHTNNTVESVQRLIGIGMSPGTIAAELLVVVSQRLAKRLCSSCKRPHKPERELIEMLYPKGVKKGVEFYKSNGCERCSYRGHSGRIAVMEMWSIDTASKELILSSSSHHDITEAAVAGGMVPMVKDAISKAENGTIALEEIPEIIPYYDIVRLKEEDEALNKSKCEK
jgi:type IV pilus assembly protein PilB